MGLGTLGGFKFQIEDRGAAGYAELDKAKAAFLAKARQAPELGPAASPATRSTCRSWTWTWTASRPSSWACR